MFHFTIKIFNILSILKYSFASFTFYFRLRPINIQSTFFFISCCFHFQSQASVTQLLLPVSPQSISHYLKLSIHTIRLYIHRYLYSFHMVSFTICCRHVHMYILTHTHISSSYHSLSLSLLFCPSSSTYIRVFLCVYLRERGKVCLFSHVYISVWTCVRKSSLFILYQRLIFFRGDRD